MILKTKKENSQGENKVQDYKFHEFSQRVIKNKDMTVKHYEIPVLENVMLKEKKELSNLIKEERNFAAISEFSISPIVKQYRGMKQQETDEYNDKIKEEVAKEINRIKDQWAQKGYEEGKKLGYEEVKKISLLQLEEQINVIKGMIEEVLKNKLQILNIQKEQILDLIKAFTKWIIIKEIKEDKDYIPRLFEKLVMELGTKENLLVKINKEHFQSMPNILEIIQQKLGELKNIRLEVDYEQEKPGIVLESLNGIIDGSFDSQMKNLDKVFVSVVGNE